jgi:hypothetical protein
MIMAIAVPGNGQRSPPFSVVIPGGSASATFAAWSTAESVGANHSVDRLPSIDSLFDYTRGVGVA